MTVPLYLDVTDWEATKLTHATVRGIRVASRKSVHRVPLTNADGEPTVWRELADAWKSGLHQLSLHTRQWWKKNPDDPSRSQPYLYRNDIDHGVVECRKAKGMPAIPCWEEPWFPPQDMPADASAHRLDIIHIRRAPLHAICGNDAWDEGIWHGNVGTDANWVHGYRTDERAETTHATPVEAYQERWEATHGDGAWARNPEVAVLTFRVKLVELWRTSWPGAAA